MSVCLVWCGVMKPVYTCTSAPIPYFRPESSQHVEWNMTSVWLLYIADTNIDSSPAFGAAPIPRQSNSDAQNHQVI